QYIDTLSGDTRKIMQEVRETIRAAAPTAEEGISYNMPAFKLNGYLVAYAAFDKHIGFYPTPSGIEKFMDQIDGKYQWAKGSIRFPLDRPMPLTLIRKIVKFRVKE